jgi:hypothetical protein
LKLCWFIVESRSRRTSELFEFCVAFGGAHG